MIETSFQFFEQKVKRVLRVKQCEHKNELKNFTECASNTSSDWFQDYFQSYPDHGSWIRFFGSKQRGKFFKETLQLNLPFHQIKSLSNS